MKRGCPLWAREVSSRGVMVPLPEEAEAEEVGGERSAARACDCFGLALTLSGSREAGGAAAWEGGEWIPGSTTRTEVG